MNLFAVVMEKPMGIIAKQGVMELINIQRESVDNILQFYFFYYPNSFVYLPIFVKSK